MENQIPRHEARKRLSKPVNRTFSEITATATTTTGSNLEELLQTFAKQQKMLLNLLITGNAADQHTTPQPAPEINLKQQTTNERPQPRQPAQEHLINFQEQLRAEANKKRNHSPEQVTTTKINKKTETGPEPLRRYGDGHRFKSSDYSDTRTSQEQNSKPKDQTFT